MGVGVNPKDELIHDLQDIADKIKSRIKENDAILAQNKVEVEKLRQRNTNISAQIKRVEDNFDTIPRQDIRVAYQDAMDVKTRLTSMQSQLEKLQDSQERLNEFYETINDVIIRLDSVVTAGALPSGIGGPAAPVRQTLSLAGEQIVRIVEAQESERRRLANALHDGPAQSLTNFILQSEICQRLFDRDPARASVELGNLKSSASISFQKIREFIFDLRPMMLDDLGLIATLRRHVENMNEKADLKVEFLLAGEDKRLPKHVEVIMFRAIQVLAGNARDLLGAKQINITLFVDPHRVRATVENNGRGFDPKVALDRTQGDSPMQNLLDLQERVELVGGSIMIDSAEGEGTRAEVIIPLTERD